MTTVYDEIIHDGHSHDIAIENNGETHDSISVNCEDIVGGCGADPYIITIEGKLYKMKNFDGYSRMIQGNYKNKLLTINIETLLTTEKEQYNIKNYLKKEMNSFKNKSISLDIFESGEYTCPDESFIRKIYIKWGEEDITIDTINLRIIENSSTFKTSFSKNIKTFTDLEAINHYNNNKSLNNMIISLDELNIVISNYSNLQIQSCFYVHHANLIENSFGAIIKPINSDKFRISSLKNEEPLLNLEETYYPSKIAKEYYINNRNQEEIVDIEIY